MALIFACASATGVADVMSRTRRPRSGGFGAMATVENTRTVREGSPNRMATLHYRSRQTIVSTLCGTWTPYANRKRCQANTTQSFSWGTGCSWRGVGGCAQVWVTAFLSHCRGNPNLHFSKIRTNDLYKNSIRNAWRASQFRKPKALA